MSSNFRAGISYPVVTDNPALDDFFEFYRYSSNTNLIDFGGLGFQNSMISVSDGLPMVFLRSSCSFPTVFRKLSNGFPMVFLWFFYGLPMVFPWFSHDFLMVFPLSSSYGFPLVFSGFPEVFL